MIVIESQYLPRVSYFKAILEHDKILIDEYENFQKQSFRNRCQIKSANKNIENLIIPTSKSGSRAMKDILLDYTQKWNSEHLHAIRSAYGKSPYFEYYWPELEMIFASKPDKLTDFNMKLLKFCLKCLQFRGEVALTDKFEDFYKEPVIDSRWIFDKKNRQIDDSLPAYSQVFGKEFEPDLSIIDLIFNCGPEARSYFNLS